MTTTVGETACPGPGRARGFVPAPAWIPYDRRSIMGTERISHLLAAHAAGNRDALSELFALVYGELKRLAHDRRRRSPSSPTLETTGLVHEAFLKLAGSEVAPRDRGHFFALAATAMRQIVIDYARGRRAGKRGGGQPVETLDDQAPGLESQVETMIALDRELERLAEVRPRQARVFECRYFAGLDVEETATALGTSHRTVERDWKEGRAWLARRLAPPGNEARR